MGNPLVVLACCNRKAPGVLPIPAYSLYQSPAFKGDLGWALSVTSLTRVWILSAKYGLISASTRIAPYSVRWREAGSVIQEELEGQARGLLALAGRGPIIALGSKPYMEVLRGLLPGVLIPFWGCYNIFYKDKVLIANRGKLPKDWVWFQSFADWNQKSTITRRLHC